MKKLIIITFLVSGCNLTDRPQVIQSSDDEQVVALPGGGALLIQAARRRQPEQTCFARARNFNGLIPISCDIAETVRLR